MNDRRTFLKQILGAGASVVVAPVVKLLPKKVAGDFSKIMIPMVRRTFPELLATEIVGVQPMSGPVGLAFAMNYVYEDKKIPWWKKLFKHTDKLLHVKKH
jgi:hypothetical protein